MRRASSGVVLVALALLGTSACRRKHIPVDVVPELGYPQCGDAGIDERGVSVGQNRIRSGPWSQEQNVVEQFELDRTSCGYTFRARQEWPLSISDVEVHYDAQLTPRWAWKRMTIPGSKRDDGNAEVRRYELRTGEVFIKRRDASGALFREKLLPGGRMTVTEGAHVGAVIGPGRGILTAWIKRAKLPVGGKTHELVLDFRGDLESLEEATLERSDDLFVASYGKKVRVYTFFGRETVFANDDDVVVGDLAGMRPRDSLATPEPPEMPTYGGPRPDITP